MVKLVDTADLKSAAFKQAYRFDSGSRHHPDWARAHPLRVSSSTLAYNALPGAMGLSNRGDSYRELASLVGSMEPRKHMAGWWAKHSPLA